MRVAPALVLLALVGAAARAAPDDGDAIAARLRADPKAAALAVALFRDRGDVVDVGADEIMDGGYRGRIHLVPQLPIGAYRTQLVWVAAALRDIDAFFAAQFPDDKPRPAYRWQKLSLQFVRSVGKRTPSAYTSGFTVTYNVVGSLLTSEVGVRETLFHELFHSNDGEHGDWSQKALATDYAAILGKCGEHPKMACLAPYAPNDTVVRGGTYYAFQQDNGASVHEYAAELAVRYFKEQSEMRAHGKLARAAFKCGPVENARAWRALVDEFFAGRDLVPSCKPA